MSSKLNNTSHTSDFEVSVEEVHVASQAHLLKAVDAARIGLTAVALLASITILGLSAHALAVYNATHVPASYLLPLWPDAFDLRPTVALVVGSSILIVVNAVSLLFSRVQRLRDRTRPHNSLTVVVPAMGLMASVIAMSFFYEINASDNVDTLQSWSCRWSEVVMLSRPHFGTLCKQSKTGLYLTVLLIPIEAVVLGVAAYQNILQRNISRTSSVVVQERNKYGSSRPLSTRDVEGERH